MTENEMQARYRELLSGPAAETAKLARDFVAPAVPIAVEEMHPLDLGHVLYFEPDRSRREDLMTVFAPHWPESPSRRAMPIRDSFDAALGQLLLVELAIETGYLALVEVLDDVRRQLTHLLWSEGGRQYLMTYDYVGIRFLAARAGVDLGLPPVVPPPPDPDAAVRFATFLSQHNVWLTDSMIEAWLRFLDDYVTFSGEQKALKHYLRTGELLPPAKEERFGLLLHGAQRFVTLLSNLFSMLEADETPRFGLMYSYWIARFYGLRLDRGRYTQTDTDWSAFIAASPLLDSAEATALTRGAELEEDLEAIRNAWDLIRELVEQCAAPPTREDLLTNQAEEQVEGHQEEAHEEPQA